MSKLCILDFDSTLVQQETIDQIFIKAFGESDAKYLIDQHLKIMESNQEYFGQLSNQIGLLEGIHKDILNDISLNYTKGAKDLINALKNKGYIVVCFSGGFHIFTSIAKKDLGLHATFSNTLEVKGDYFTGRFCGPMGFSASKGRWIQEIQSLTGITRENTMVIGDGSNDLSMFEYSDKRVAFCAKEILKEKATIVISEPDLSLVIPYI